jgi:hypothetical protein
LYTILPVQRIDFILQLSGRVEQRQRRLPARSMTLFVVAMSLFPELSIPQVWRRLHPAQETPEPVESAFVQARARLGVTPLRKLFHEVAQPIATSDTRGAFYRGMRLMALDGTVLDMPDTPANAALFGRPQSGRSEGAFPQVRLLVLCELGTHVVCGLNLRPLKYGEQCMVRGLLPRLPAGSLLLWDRNFLSYELIQAVLQHGAHLLARAKSNLVLEPIEHLPDGSYLAKIYPTPKDRRHDRHGIVVRVIEYTHDDPGRPGCGQRHRLITDLLDPSQLPAEEAPLVYHERWEEELALDEIKTHLNGRDVPLRSKTPRGVVQELYGLMLAHLIIRRTMHDAAVSQDIDPDRLSFTDSYRVLQSHLPEAPHKAPAVWYADLVREVRRQQLRPRRDRWYPRVIKRKMSNWLKKRPHHKNPRQPTKPFRNAVVMLN